MSLRNPKEESVNEEYIRKRGQKWKGNGVGGGQIMWGLVGQRT